MSTSDRPATRRYHHGDLRRSLLQAAREKLDREQTWDFTLRELAQRTGVSHAAPYKHFIDKQALLIELASEGFDELRQALVAAGLQHPDDPEAAIYAMSQAYVTFAIQHAAHFRLMFGPALAGEARTAQLLEHANASRQVLVDAIARLNRGGALDPEQLELRALAAHALVHGLATLTIDWRKGLNLSDAQRGASEIMRLFTHCMKGQQSRT
jgi:AcrR family transcriptional regulator